MFPSTSTPFPFDTCKPTLPPLSFLHFPPPPPPSFEDHEIFHYHTHPHLHHDHDLFLLHHPQEVEDQSPCVAEANNGSNHSMEASRNKSSTDEKEQEHELEIPVRGGGWSGKSGSCKRDRHSKIKTARGLRDRRMRLSLQVAKRFFGLQDMLGFDKASKTVEWLLNHSKDEIKQLAIQNINHHHHHLHAHDDHEGRLVRSTASSTNSECEGVSGLDEVAFISSGEVPLVVKRGRASKGSRKRRSGALLHPIIGRESRQKARERARERTKEKEKMKSHKLLIEAAAHDTTTSTTTNHFNNNLTQFCSWNPFEAGGSSQESGKVSSPSLDVMLEPQQQQRSSQSKDDDSLVINIGKGSPSMIFSSFNYSAFLQEHQFAEFQSLAKLWEAYNNHMI